MASHLEAVVHRVADLAIPEIRDDDVQNRGKAWRVCSALDEERRGRRNRRVKASSQRERRKSRSDEGSEHAR